SCLIGSRRFSRCEKMQEKWGRFTHRKNGDVLHKPSCLKRLRRNGPLERGSTRQLGARLLGSFVGPTVLAPPAFLIPRRSPCRPRCRTRPCFRESTPPDPLRMYYSPRRNPPATWCSWRWPCSVPRRLARRCPTPHSRAWY